MNNIEIHELLNKNCMDYARYTILDRAIVDLRDGMKNIHRRIVWSMHLDGLHHDKSRTKSINASASVLRFSPHGDSSVYGACVRLATDNVMYPLIDGKGAFGTATSRDLQAGASRYTEMRLAPITQEILRDIDKDSVPMQLNYDDTRLEPEVMPVTFPLVLINPNSGIAVGIASKICSFNLNDVIDNTIRCIKGDELKVMIPDFPTGANIIYNKKILNKIHNEGVGSVRLTSKYEINKNSISIKEIPYTTTREEIIESIISLVKEGKVKEVVDVNDNSGADGFEITIDVKPYTNIDLLIKKLFKMTPLSSTFACNFTMLDNEKPKTLGVKQIIPKWIEFRIETLKNIINHDIKNKTKKLHLLKGLENVLLDIDRCIEIIRKSNSTEIINKLMCHFSIDENQANEVSNMKLRNINKDYILKQIKDIEKLENELVKLQDTVNNRDKICEIIINQLQDVSKKYGQPRKTEIIYEDEISTTSISKEDLIEDYNCRILFTKDGYIKKYLRQSDNHKLKDGDVIMGDMISTNKSTLLIFTNKANRYKLNTYELDTMTPQSYGSFIRNIINLEDDEEVIKVVSIEKEVGYMAFIYDTGKLSKINIKSYLSNNKKLQNCYNVDSKLVAIEYIIEDVDCLLITSEGKALIVNTNNIASKGTRNSQGNVSIKLPENIKCIGATINILTDDKFVLKTAKGKSKEFLLDDIAPTGKSNEERTLFTYLYGRSGVQGNFVINTRNSEGEFIIKYIKI